MHILQGFLFKIVLIYRYFIDDTILLGSILKYVTYI